LYCVPNSKTSRLIMKVASVFYTVVIPTLNSLIYSLRNKYVKDIVSKIFDIKIYFEHHYDGVCLSKHFIKFDVK
jgi:olfactory receptor